MLLTLVAFLAGVVVLVLAAERSVGEAELLSERLGLSPIIVGALIVGLGTSLPEMVVSGLAAAQRDTIDLAIGNVVGSNAANLTLVLGAGAVVTDVSARRSVYRREGALVVGATVLLVLSVVDGSLARWEGAVLLVAMVAAATILARGGGHRPAMPDPSSRRANAVSAIKIVIGLCGVVTGAQLLVVSSVEIADRLGAPEGLIGLTIVAIGTSLPELATTIAAARRRSVELIIGNVFGSNVFNCLAVGGITGLVGSGRLDHTPTLSIAVMLSVTFAAVVAGAVGRSFSRTDGLGLLAMYSVALLVAR
jgi:cation:H+ antiporter